MLWKNKCCGGIGFGPARMSRDFGNAIHLHTWGGKKADDETFQLNYSFFFSSISKQKATKD